MLRAKRYDTVLRVTRYVAIRAPVLTILLSLPNYYVTTYLVTLGYTTAGRTDLGHKPYSHPLQQLICDHLE